MKNYLVGAVRPVFKVWYPGSNDRIAERDNPNANNHVTNYQEMYRVSRLSAQKFLQGPYEEICFTAPVLDARMFQIAQWYMIKELWFKEPCNILCMGADTLFKQPTEIFGKYTGMHMFNYTDPKTHSELIKYGFNGDYFNDDIRYFSSTMDPKIWEIGERYMSGWFGNVEAGWGWGQLIHNHMLWSQKISPNQMFEPAMAFQITNVDQLTSEQQNQCLYKNAHVLHFHGSRDCNNRAEVMPTIAREFGIIE
jgi:hypothetical protein